MNQNPKSFYRGTGSSSRSNSSSPRKTSNNQRAETSLKSRKAPRRRRPNQQPKGARARSSRTSRRNSFFGDKRIFSSSSGRRSRSPRQLPDNTPRGVTRSTWGGRRPHRSIYASRRHGSSPKTFVFVLLVAVVVLAVVVPRFADEDSSPVSSDAQSLAPQVFEYEPTIESLDYIVDQGESVIGFSLSSNSGNYVPAMSERQLSSIQGLLDIYEPADRSVGFALINLNTGNGYAYNIDTKIYGASSFKGHVAVYACQEWVEKNKIKLSSIKSNAEAAVVWSDNNSFVRLRRSVGALGDTAALQDWLAAVGVDPEVANDTTYPHYTVRDSLKLWMNTYQYFQTGNPDIVNWLKSLFEQTNVSMIRDGVSSSDLTGLVLSAKESALFSICKTILQPIVIPGETASEASSEPSQDSKGSSLSENDESVNVADEETAGGLTVYNKAGWISGTEVDAVCDAGIIVDGDTVYLLSIMTSAPDSEPNRELVSDLAASIWATRGTLD